MIHKLDVVTFSFPKYLILVCFGDLQREFSSLCKKIFSLFSKNHIFYRLFSFQLSKLKMGNLRFQPQFGSSEE